VGGQATPRSDVYSFGVVLHEMLIGGRPDSASTVDLDTTVESRRKQRLRSVISRCLANDPDSRFQSAVAAVAALETAMQPPHLVTRRKLFATGVSAAVLGGGLVLERDYINRLMHPVPRPRRVAVLPAPDVRLSTADASLLNGLLESVTGELARTEPAEEDLFVIPTRYLRGGSEMSQALGLFGANLLLCISLQHLPESIALNLQLNQSSTGRSLRRTKVICGISTLYTLTELVANRAALLLDIRHKYPLQPPARGYTTIAEAYAAYERGRGLLRGYGLPTVDQAIAELQKAVDLDPRFALAWAALSEAYSRRHHLTRDPAALDVADRNVAKALELAPDLSEAYSSRARIELYRGLYDAAVRDAERATQLDPNNVEAKVSLAQTYVSSGKLDSAERAYEQLTKDRPNDWLVLNDWGDLSMSQANYGRAEKLFREATTVAPQAALPWRNLGAVYLAIGHLEDADRALKRSIDLLPSGEAYTNLGTALFWLGQYRQAADAYSHAIDLNPQRAMLWRNLGDAYQMLPGMNEKAKAAWRKAAELTTALVEVNPNNLDELINLGLYKAKLGDNEAALSSLRRASSLRSPTVEQVFQEALVYELVGKRDAALRLLAECVRKGYSSADILHAPELQNLRKDPRFKSLDAKIAAR
jgi:eukaryotic-like serine/threonine-protein kinase